ncbi:host attachment protein [Roseomonas sp. E05]|uniref:host attachment protein n=1 Tax=Roseomonas sp. E05 TaxID=3046310 RepID=UPI0024BB13B4|nr:host attachment protein [Roseomonas sp. E05]MDJ0390523.1 host attachment protein [Roseomonas sp. E05]
MQGHPVWVLVADAGRARILERAALNAAWQERTEQECRNAVPPSRELTSDRPGRVVESVGGARHAVEPRHDPHDAAEADFARELAKKLEADAAQGRYARLMLVAPPRFLGQLTRNLGDAARHRLRGTLDKDLVRAPLPDIVAHLPEHRPA